jgi:aerobic carbon-monoxide dehydrogenase large subunit
VATDNISRPVRRREDARLITGRGRFADDINLPGQTWAAFVRSSVSHGEIRAIDVTACREAEGVVGVFTIDELREAGVGNIPFLAPAGFDMPEPAKAPRPPLAEGRVRHTGEPIALVVAETLAQASDAAELAIVDIDPLPVVTDPAAAVEESAPIIWPDAARNVALTWHHGDRAAADAAFARAHHITRLRLVNNRVIANPIEPRSSIATFDPAVDRYGLVAATQGVQYMIRVLCENTFRVPREQMHVLTYDVGGAFGVKEQPYPEDVCILHAARVLGRPVRWQGTRAEHLLSDNHARDAVIDCALALDENGHFLAVRADILDAMGAYYSVHGPYVTIRNTTNGLPLVYRTPHMDVTVRLVMTNTAPTGPYRGAGREQAAYIMERLVDAAAREMAIDPVELRRRNFVPPEQLPYRTPAGREYDSGAFEEVMNKTLALADWEGFAAREVASQAAGKLRGRGLCCFVECVGGVPYESSYIRFADDGLINVVVATQSSGQGHETSFAQLVSDRLGVPMEAVRLCQGDSADVPRGLASIASRSMFMAGSAIHLTCEAVVDKGMKLAAHMLEAPPNDVEFSRGSFRIIGTDRAIPILELSQKLRTVSLPPGLPSSLDSEGDFDVEDLNFPNGCHVCEVEIDKDTGQVQVVGYAAVDDVGTVINPMIVHGQIHGGVTQGLGQALMEGVIYDADGQLISGSLMDYALPRAEDVPFFQVDFHPVPALCNPLGVKGAGESGVAGSVTAVMHAVIDALARAGANVDFEMPATSEKVWRAIHAVTP